MDIKQHNREAWNRLVEKGDRWTVPVSSEEVARAREGDWSIVLTPEKPVPRDWFGDLVVNPCSNCFIPDVLPMWRECYRVLAPGGVLITGFTNPVRYLFDDAAYESEDFRIRYAIPYADSESLTPEEQLKLKSDGEPLQFGHSLEAQLGGQIAAGFVLTGLYEDGYGQADRLSKYLPTFMATRALRPAGG